MAHKDLDDKDFRNLLELYQCVSCSMHLKDFLHTHGYIDIQDCDLQHYKLYFLDISSNRDQCISYSYRLDSWNIHHSVHIQVYNMGDCRHNYPSRYIRLDLHAPCNYYLDRKETHNMDLCQIQDILEF